MSDPGNELVKIAPPVPAPYLASVPHLPADVLADIRAQRRLTAEQQIRATHILKALKLRVRQERTAFERAHGVEIQSEPRTKC